jgi:hypothetical protein
MLNVCPAPCWLHDDHHGGGNNYDGYNNDDNDFDYNDKQNSKLKSESVPYMTGALHATEWRTLYLRYFLSLNLPRRLCTEVL